MTIKQMMINCNKTSKEFGLLTAGVYQPELFF
jgi:hypothetical protein